MNETENINGIAIHFVDLPQIASVKEV